MNWYLAKIVFKIVSNEATGSQFDEQLCLIEARDEQEAFIKARMLGVKNEEELDGSGQRKVSWKFIDVPFLNPLPQFADGLELYSSIYEADADEAYEKYVKKRAAQIEGSLKRNMVSNS